MVAQRGHLRGLLAQLRRRERRRHRRPRRRPRAAALPARPRRRRHLVHARGTSRRSPTAATTSPTTGPSTRPSGRSRRRRRSSPRRSRWASGRSSTSSPTTCPTEHPWFQAALARRTRLAGARPVLVPPRSRRRTATSMPTGWRSNFSGDRPGPARPTRTARPASGTCTCSRPSSPTSTGTTRTSAREHEDILRFWFDRGRGRRPHRLRGAAGQGPGAARGPGRPAARRAPQHGPRRAPRHLPQLARRSPTAIPARASSSARCGCRTSSGSPATSARTSSTPPSTSTSWPGPGTPPSLRASIDATLAAHAPVGAPATWVLSNHDVTRPVTRLRPGGQLVRVRPQAAGHADRPRRSGDAGRARRRSSPPRCPARCTSTRATSSGLDEVDGPARRRSSRTRCTSARAAIDPGRDGCRVPLPWSGDARAVRVQPRRRDRRAVARASRRTGPTLTVEAQAADPGSMLNLYRSALRIRRAEPGLGDGPLRLAAVRRRRARLRARRRFVCVTNLSHAPRCRCPPDAAVLLASADVSRRAPAGRRDGVAAPGPRRPTAQRGGCPRMR